jgi:SAM-dependent methyltransferase
MTDETFKGVRLRYDCDPSLLPPRLADLFVKLELDDEGREYLERATHSRPGRTRTFAHRWLRSLVSDFDANALLQMYPMHLLGTSQWRALLGPAPNARHLDVGAGAGDVTRTLAPLAGETVTTETSRFMARNLRRLGFTCFRTDVAESGVPDPRYDLVTCLNVIDRCARPKTLLTRVAEGLSPNGRLVIATPLPLDAFVYDGPRSLDPRERLDVRADSWERALSELTEGVLSMLGFEVNAVSRVPYLCRGDADEPLYVLDDAILVCSAKRS